MSPMAGINFLDVNLSTDVQLPRLARPDKILSVLDFFREAYDGEGTSHWPSKTAEWFIVRLITRVLVVPHLNSAGITIPIIQKAYLPLVRDLVCRHKNYSSTT